MTRRRRIASTECRGSSHGVELWRLYVEGAAKVPEIDDATPIVTDTKGALVTAQELARRVMQSIWRAWKRTAHGKASRTGGGLKPPAQSLDSLDNTTPIMEDAEGNPVTARELAFRIEVASEHAKQHQTVREQGKRPLIESDGRITALHYRANTARMALQNFYGITMSPTARPEAVLRRLAEVQEEHAAASVAASA